MEILICVRDGLRERRGSLQHREPEKKNKTVASSGKLL